jgi:hypothetical protein
MAVGREDVDRWIKTAKEKKCQFIISVCDTFDWDDFPVYCKDKNDLIMTYERYDGVDMLKINEIIQIIDDNVIENLNIDTIL